MKPNCEFVDVQCKGGAFSLVTVHTNTFAQILLPVIEYDNHTKPHHGASNHQSSVNTTNNKRSVILFVLDSVSRSNFLRQLPKTTEVLKRDYNAIIMNGLVKNGDHSLPNAMAFLAGWLLLCNTSHTTPFIRPEASSRVFFSTRKIF